MAAKILLIAISILVVFVPARGRASCASIEGCYCSLAGGPETATVLADVTAADGDTVDLLVSGQPILDPGGLVPFDAQLVSLLCQYRSACSSLDVGARGVFVVDVGSHAVDQFEAIVDDRVGCGGFDDFEGLDLDQLEGVLNAADCYQAIREVLGHMGYEPPPCKDVFSSCGCADAGAGGWGGAGLLIGLLLALGQARRRLSPRSPCAR